MRVPLLLIFALGALAGPAPTADAQPRKPPTKTKAKPEPRQLIVLDGKEEQVNWNDGDSFRILRGPREGQQARLIGYNTLESHGPVHFWGDFDGNELYQTHVEATALAQGHKWVCETSDEADAYGRVLVLCAELRMRLIELGLAHVYAFRSEPDPELLAAQHRAQDERRGMWAKGIPRAIVTNVHSFEPKAPPPPRGEDDDEAADGDEAPKPKTDARPPRTAAFNSMADTGTGKVFSARHTEALQVCDAFCHSGSCMLYIPFDARYGAKKAPCLTEEVGRKNRMTARRHLNQPLATGD